MIENEARGEGLKDSGQKAYRAAGRGPAKEEFVCWFYGPPISAGGYGE